MNLLRITILLFFGICQSNFAQTDSTVYKFIGLGFGTNLTKTDLSETFSKPSLAFNAFLQFDRPKRLSSAVHLTVGQLISESRNVKFVDQSEFKINDFAQTNYQSVHFEAVFSIIKKSNWSISLAQGFGFMRFNVYDKNNNPLIDQLNSRAFTEDYTGFAVMLPTSAKAHYVFKNNFGLSANLGLLNVLTDYLDNISTFGNAENNDNVLVMQLSLFKRFNTLRSNK